MKNRTVPGTKGISAPNSEPPSTVRLVIVTRHRLDGDALAALFHAHENFRVLCTTTSIRVATVVGQHRHPDAVVLDGGLIGDDHNCNSISLLHQFQKIPILVLDDDVHNGRLATMLDLSHVGYFTRRAPFAELAEGIRRLVKGERVFDPAVRGRIHETPHGWQLRRDQDAAHLGLLTPREIEVLRLIAQGHTVKRCAEVLELAPSTVDNHKARLMKKLGIHKSLDLTRLALREGLVHF